MEKYIRADALVKVLEERMTKIAEAAGPADSPVIEGYMCAMRHAIDFVNATPYADVVQKAEVEWMEELVVCKCDRCTDRVRSAVAADIFAEIEKHLFVATPIEKFDGWARIQLADIMAIKKKYVGGDSDAG